MLECKTFRMTGHSAHDAAEYVPKGLFDEWGKLDPITRLEARMIAEKPGPIAPSSISAHDPPSARKWTTRWSGLKRSPFPDPATLLDDVFASQ